MSNLFPPSHHLEFAERVRYGDGAEIPLTRLEHRLIGHALFQALSGQSLVPFLNFPFPSANNNLFLLALARLLLGTQFLDAVVKNAGLAQRKGRIAQEPKEGEVPRLGQELGTDGVVKLAMAVRFAALFFRSGRGPLDALDPFYPTLRQAAGWFGGRFVCGPDGRPQETTVEVDIEEEHVKVSQERGASGPVREVRTKVRTKVRKAFACLQREDPLALLVPLYPAIEAEFARRQEASGGKEPRVWAGFLSAVVFALAMADALKDLGLIEVRTIDMLEEIPDSRTGAMRRVLVRQERFVFSPEDKMVSAFLAAAAAIMDLDPIETDRRGSVAGGIRLGQGGGACQEAGWACFFGPESGRIPPPLDTGSASWAACAGRGDAASLDSGGDGAGVCRADDAECPLAESSSNLLPAWIRNWTPFVRDIVAGVPVGAALVASIECDGKACGTAYGRVPKTQLLGAILPVLAEGRVRVGWRLTGIGAVETTVFQHSQMVQHVYGDNEADAARCMLRRAVRLWDGVDPAIVDLSTLERYRAFISGFGRDDAFLSLLAGHVGIQGRSSHPPFTDIPLRLTGRDGWSNVGTFRDLDDAAAIELHRAVVQKVAQLGVRAEVITVRIGFGAVDPLVNAPVRALNADEEGHYRQMGPARKRWREVTRVLAAIASSRPFLRIYVDVGPYGKVPDAVKHAASGAFNRLAWDDSPVPAARASVPPPSFSPEEAFTLKGRQPVPSQGRGLSSEERREGILAAEVVAPWPSVSPSSVPSARVPSFSVPPPDGIPPASAAPGDEPDPVSGPVSVVPPAEPAAGVPVSAADSEAPTERPDPGDPAPAPAPADAPADSVPSSVNGKALET